jgi:ribose transport system permease protein
MASASQATGKSILFAETFGCCIRRYWFDGEKAGTTEMVIDNCRATPTTSTSPPTAITGSPWSACAAPRSISAWKMPGFRKRMGKRVPIDEWLFPNINTGCVIKFNERGEVLESFWDLRGENHPMITSMREHSGYLYLGGIMNNRIGRLKLDGADPTSCNTTGAGERAMIATLKAFGDRVLGRATRRSPCRSSTAR